MIESKLAFFEMPIEGAFVDPTKTDEPGFGIAPTSFNAIHLRSTADEFIVAVIDAKVPPISDIDQTVIAPPPIRIDHTIQCHLPSNNRLQPGFSTIRDQFRIDLSIALENPKDDRFAIGSSAALALNPTSTNVRCIDFDLATERRLGFADESNALSQSVNIAIDRVAIHPSQERNL